jgi:hypothetical protein
MTGKTADPLGPEKRSGPSNHGLDGYPANGQFVTTFGNRPPPS